MTNTAAPVADTTTEGQTDDAPKRLSIADGHSRPEPLIEMGLDQYGRTVIANEVHYAPRPVHLSFDPETGQVYAGFTPASALGVDEPDTSQDDLDAAEEYRQFQAFRAQQKLSDPKASFPGQVVAPVDLDKE